MANKEFSLITMRPGELDREISVLPEGLPPHAAPHTENAAEFQHLSSIKII